MTIDRAKIAAGARQSGIFPIDVQAVQVVLMKEVHDALNEDLSALRGERSVRKIVGPEPSADGNQDGEAGIILPQTGQEGVVFRIVRKAGDHVAAFDVGEGVVDAIEGVGVDLARLKRRVLLEDVSHDDGPSGLGRGGADRRQQQESGDKGATGDSWHEILFNQSCTCLAIAVCKTANLTRDSLTWQIWRRWPEVRCSPQD
jgi:hypothetical protein